jgi:hypothetical protein
MSPFKYNLRRFSLDEMMLKWPDWGDENPKFRLYGVELTFIVVDC